MQDETGEVPAPKRQRPHYEGDPTLLRVMLTPKWIAALILALIVAGVFAWLGQWQLGHAIASQTPPEEVEQVRSLASTTSAGAPVDDELAGFVFDASGAFVDGDFGVVEGRSNGGELGAWVIGHFAVASDQGEEAGHLAVAIGWAGDAEEATRSLPTVADHLVGKRLEVEGRYMPGDAPVRPEAGTDPMRLLSMAPAQVINTWAPYEGGAYAGYLVLHPAADVHTDQLRGMGLDPIDSVPPLPVESINWLNLFYAVEWVVFAGFAFFFWYRLARDDWEKRHELQLQAAADETSLQA